MIKSGVKRLIARFGYDGCRHPNNASGGGWRPWPGGICQLNDTEFESVFDKADLDQLLLPNVKSCTGEASRYSMLKKLLRSFAPRNAPPDSVTGKIARCYMLKSLLVSFAPCHASADVAECGVYRGRSAYVIAHYLRKIGFGRAHTLHLFDSWEGQPNPDPAFDNTDVLKKGMYSATMESVASHLSEFEFVKLHRGWIPESLNAVHNRTFSFVHIDLNLYHSTADAIQFFWNRLTTPAVMVFDDYGFSGSVGERNALDGFCKTNNIQLTYLPTGQAVIWHL